MAHDLRLGLVVGCRAASPVSTLGEVRSRCASEIRRSRQLNSQGFADGND